MRTTNWAGNVTFGARRVHTPRSVHELAELVAGSPRVRALGTGHSFSRIADTPGDLIRVGGLPPVTDIDDRKHTVTVAAGVRYGELVTRLHAAGYALANLGSLPHISVGGACATGTHGSGDAHGNLSTAVSALGLVRADGESATVERAGAEGPGAVVHLGRLGIVTQLTLALVPAFELRQYVYLDLPWHTDWAEVFAAGYSVSLFTRWGATVDQVWVKTRTPMPDAWLGARLADRPMHPVPGMPADHCTEQFGTPGPWFSRLPHFRLEFTPSSGQELQSEFFVPRAATAEALAAVRSLGDRIAPVLQVSEVRTVAADDLWLSPCYGRDSVAIHFTWIDDADAVAPVLAAVEERLAPYGPRPHWGKLYTEPFEAVADRYPRIEDFRRLAARLDPAGKFG